MQTTKLTRGVISAAAMVLGLAPMANAQASRTWVSGVGDDANPCSRTAPCKTFAGAISKTAAGGEIDALDPGGFGAVTITKSITIDGGCGVASVLAASGSNGIVVAASPNDVVTLRRLSVNGISASISPGLNGIRFLSGKQLNVEDSEIFGFPGNCIDVSLSAAAGMNVHNVNMHECAGSGVNATDSAANFQATIDNVSVVNSGNGLHALTNSRMAVFRSTFSNNNNGVFADSGSAEFSLEDNQINYNTNAGVQITGGGIFISNNTITRNGTGLITGGGLITTYTNNRVFLNNFADGAGNATATFK